MPPAVNSAAGYSNVLLLKNARSCSVPILGGHLFLFDLEELFVGKNSIQGLYMLQVIYLFLILFLATSSTILIFI